MHTLMQMWCEMGPSDSVMIDPLFSLYPASVLNFLVSLGVTSSICIATSSTSAVSTDRSILPITGKEQKGRQQKYRDEITVAYSVRWDNMFLGGLVVNFLASLFAQIVFFVFLSNTCWCHHHLHVKTKTIRKNRLKTFGKPLWNPGTFQEPFKNWSFPTEGGSFPTAEGGGKTGGKEISMRDFQFLPITFTRCPKVASLLSVNFRFLV